MISLTRTSVLAVVAALASPLPASADFWTRVDRPWSNEELDRAIAFCHIQPRMTADTRQFVGVVMGEQIDRCMRALGWIGVAR
jgi:hypothetical protein